MIYLFLIFALNISGLCRTQTLDQETQTTAPPSVQLHLNTSAFLCARHVQLNGEKLLMADNETFPELKPKTLRAGRTIAMPPMTIGFYVIKNINAYACRR